MKTLGFAAVSALALLGLASADCCRTARNPCLRAITSASDSGIADCESALLTTFTVTRTVTETLTSVESDVATELFTENETQTASTETLLFTVSSTVTASTQTEVVTQTMTAPVTITDVQLAPAVTSTSTNFQAAVLTVRDAANLPEYASTCGSWDRYTSACSCAGVDAITITVPAPLETVTVPADGVLTTIVSTLSVTETEVLSVTATASSTETDVISLTETAVTTQTDVVPSTITTSATATPTVVVPLTCKPRSLSWRASNPFPGGSTRFMDVVGNGFIQWETFYGNPDEGSLATSTWTLDDNAYLQLSGLLGQNLAAYVDAITATTTTFSLDVFVGGVDDVNAGVAAGRMLRVAGCVRADTNEVTLIAAGRSNMLACGNDLYLSTGDGTDVQDDCVFLHPQANFA